MFLDPVFLYTAREIRTWLKDGAAYQTINSMFVQILLILVAFVGENFTLTSGPSEEFSPAIHAYKLYSDELFFFTRFSLIPCSVCGHKIIFYLCFIYN